MNDDMNAIPGTTKKEEDTAVQKNLEEIGGRVKAIRKELRLKQTEMAEKLGTFYSYISAVEKGKANPGHGFFFKISTIYNVNLNYLFHGKGEMFLSDKTDEPEKLSERAIKDYLLILKQFDQMDPDFMLWIMEYSPLFYHNVIGFAFRFWYDNEKAISREVEKNVEKKKKLEEIEKAYRR